MSHTTDHLFLKAVEAGVSMDEYIMAENILRAQEMEGILERELTDVELDCLDCRGPYTMEED